MGKNENNRSDSFSPEAVLNRSKRLRVENFMPAVSRFTDLAHSYAASHAGHT